MELPEVVWELILCHFDTKSLRNCLLWSKFFRELVINSPALMRKLPVIFYGNSWKEKISFVEKHGKSVKSVKFVKCVFKDVNEIKIILRMTPNVEKISCDDVSATADENIEAVENNDGKENMDLNF